ncbi:MAG: 3',5'-cyclic-nucleotide phosphodiesterase [Planctomycetes bacterium]|nr:3',5'-cyclic-nucleotide phosphodiesterase [Planctomycetota bacterium]
MRIRVLGTSGGCSAGCPPSAYLVDGRLAVDAGALATALTLEEQSAVEDVLLTHSHLDHVRDLPLMVINGNRSETPLRVHGLPSTLEAVRTHLFNRQIWFEAFTIPVPMIAALPLPAGEERRIGPYRVTGFPMHHTIETQGFLVDDGRGAVFIAGDTDDPDCLAPVVAAAGKRLRAVFLEASFPDDQAEFATHTGHLTPRGLGRAARAVPPGVPVLATHMKPGHEAAIAAEIRALGNPALRPAHPGEVIEV